MNADAHVTGPETIVIPEHEEVVHPAVRVIIRVTRVIGSEHQVTAGGRSVEEPAVQIDVVGTATGFSRVVDVDDQIVVEGDASVKFDLAAVGEGFDQEALGLSRVVDDPEVVIELEGRAGDVVAGRAELGDSLATDRSEGDELAAVGDGVASAKIIRLSGSIKTALKDGDCPRVIRDIRADREGALAVLDDVSGPRGVAEAAVVQTKSLAVDDIEHRRSFDGVDAV